LKVLPALVLPLLLIEGCAAHRPDHFYALVAQPGGVRESRVGFARQVVLRVTLPALIDRGELVLPEHD
jgi:uncharacterized lipoprotein YmbA